MGHLLLHCPRDSSVVEAEKYGRRLCYVLCGGMSVIAEHLKGSSILAMSSKSIGWDVCMNG